MLGTEMRELVSDYYQLPLNLTLAPHVMAGLDPTGFTHLNH